MIRELYILDEGGICLFFQDYTSGASGKDQVNPQLISGFFSAIMAFAQNSHACPDTDAAPVDKISMQNITYYFNKENHFYFIIKCDNIATLKQEQIYSGVLHDVADLFKKFVQEEKIDTVQFKVIENKEFEVAVKDIISKSIRKALFAK